MAVYRPLVLALIVTACVGGPALPTLPVSDGGVEECPQALLGPVTIEQRNDADVPVVAVLEDGSSIDLLWARGYTATFTPLTLQNADGEVVAYGGDRVWLTGGSTADEAFFVCGVSDTMP